VYFFDNADVLGDDGARFENLVATHLLKQLHYLEDSQGYRYELAYLRDKSGREVDFVILKDGIIQELTEAKWSDEKPSPSLQYFAERLRPLRATQIVAKLKNEFTKNKLHVCGPLEKLSNLLIP
jgi:predicted AAA+ superfamily ATPase